MTRKAGTSGGAGRTLRAVGRSEQPEAEREVVLELGDTDLMSALRGLRRRLPPLLDEAPGTLVVDMSGLTQVSSATVAALLWVKRRCRSRGVVVMLRQPSPRSLDLLRRTGLHGSLPVESADPVPRRRAAGRPRRLRRVR